MKACTAFCVAVLLLGCSEERPVAVGVDRVKSALSVNDALPEDVPSEAIRKHGFPQLLKWAEEGHRKAQYMVAYAYIEGAPGVPRNDEQAVMWLRRSANAGSASAQIAIGRLAMSRAGSTNLLEIDKKLIRAYVWLNLAHANGHPTARKLLDDLTAIIGRDDDQIVARAQAISARWQPCTSKTCWDQDFQIPPSPRCASNPTRFDCLIDQASAKP